MKTIFITGYKSHEIGIFKNDDPAVRIIRKSIRQHLVSLADEGLEWVLVSGSLGVELWAAEEVISLKETLPELKLAILTPFLNQEEKWSEGNQSYYHDIIKKADFVSSISNKPYTDPSQFKNRDDFILQKADGLLVIYDEDKKGSPSFLLEKAEKENMTYNLDIIRINFQDLQWIADEEALSESEPD
ncbi:hypothetical protein KP77_21010 [Jeotgalibacillus alimentarius]|uniref:UPF0398 protein KP77_21010 n=1 Tax=Jeotgalibacillus alimentarius TaxID=135826 RepID=A0A0C2RFC8_9BACL|nr:DUF1273 domain-containing protein [Jeotgalibacillus alimentarius]KIL48890.1 hypothetical protein KP77_21010 [Jeotgalibacillus alimentarius]